MTTEIDALESHLVTSPDGSMTLEARVVRPEDAALAPTSDGQHDWYDVPLIPIDGLLEAIPTLVAALHAGHVVQVVGPTHLLEGLRSGALHALHSDGGFLG